MDNMVFLQIIWNGLPMDKPHKLYINRGLCTYDDTGVFFLGVPPTGGFLLDFSGELDPVTERSGINRG